MLSLLVVVLGTVLSLFGLVAVAPQVKARRIDGASMAAWLFRSGALVLLAGEAVAFAARPDPIVYKVMLIAGGAILFVGLTMLPREWQQPGFVLERSLSWHIALLGLAGFWTAVMFVEAITAFVGAGASYLAARYLRTQAAKGKIDFNTMRLATLAARGAAALFTILFLFL